MINFAIGELWSTSRGTMRWLCRQWNCADNKCAGCVGGELCGRWQAQLCNGEAEEHAAVGKCSRVRVRVKVRVRVRVRVRE